MQVELKLQDSLPNGIFLDQYDSNNHKMKLGVTLDITVGEIVAVVMRTLKREVNGICVGGFVSLSSVKFKGVNLDPLSQQSLKEIGAQNTDTLHIRVNACFGIGLCRLVSCRARSAECMRIAPAAAAAWRGV